jgi:hypothetical protein
MTRLPRTTRTPTRYVPTHPQVRISVRCPLFRLTRHPLGGVSPTPNRGKFPIPVLRVPDVAIPGGGTVRRPAGSPPTAGWRSGDRRRARSPATCHRRRTNHHRTSRTSRRCCHCAVRSQRHRNRLRHNRRRTSDPGTARSRLTGSHRTGSRRTSNRRISNRRISNRRMSSRTGSRLTARHPNRHRPASVRYRPRLAPHPGSVPTSTGRTTPVRDGFPNGATATASTGPAPARMASQPSRSAG